jgi:hypothetical protein
MSEGKTMWIVGKWCSGENGELNSVWDINGVFDSEEKAIAACDDRPNYFVGPLTLNESLPDKTTEWVGCYYPALTVK